MKIVRQTNHRTCQQACIAMLAGVAIEEVIAFVGDLELGANDRLRAMEHFGVPYPKDGAGFVVGVLEHPLVKLMRDHETLYCDVADWKNPNWGHAVVIYDAHIYDPWRGIDPDWPWTRHVWKAVPIGDRKGPQLGPGAFA